MIFLKGKLSGLHLKKRYLKGELWSGEENKEIPKIDQAQF